MPQKSAEHWYHLSQERGSQQLKNMTLFCTLVKLSHVIIFGLFTHHEQYPKLIHV